MFHLPFFNGLCQHSLWGRCHLSHHTTPPLFTWSNTQHPKVVQWWCDGWNGPPATKYCLDSVSVTPRKYHLGQTTSFLLLHYCSIQKKMFKSIDILFLHFNSQSTHIHIAGEILSIIYHNNRKNQFLCVHSSIHFYMSNYSSVPPQYFHWGRDSPTTL